MSRFITSPKIFEGSQIKPENYGITWRFHPEGIFSETIFGPIADYTCACNIVRPPKYVCPVCGVEAKPAYMRAYTVGKIKLNVPVVHPLILYLLKRYDKLFNLFIVAEDGSIESKTTSVYLDKKVLSPFGVFVHLLAKIYDTDVNSLMGDYGYVAIETELYREEDSQLYEQVATEIFEKVAAHTRLIDGIRQTVSPDKAITDTISVLPAGVRDLNVVYGKNLTILSLHRINHQYIDLLLANEKINIQELSTKYYLYSNMLRRLQNIEYMIISSFIKKKSGPVRGRTLGRRIDLSTRTVLVGNPAIAPDALVIPYICALMLVEDYVIKELLEQGYDAELLVDYAYQTLRVPRVIKEIIRKIITERDIYVLLMRQPVLHLPSTIQFKIGGVYDGYAIMMNQLSWEGYNADADGDTVVLFYLDQENPKFRLEKHLLVPHGGLNINILYDSLAGYLIATS